MFSSIYLTALMKIVSSKGINLYARWIKYSLLLHSPSSIQVVPKMEELYAFQIVLRHVKNALIL